MQKYRNFQQMAWIPLEVLLLSCWQWTCSNLTSFLCIFQECFSAFELFHIIFEYVSFLHVQTWIVFYQLMRSLWVYLCFCFRHTLIFAFVVPIFQLYSCSSLWICSSSSFPSIFVVFLHRSRTRRQHFSERRCHFCPRSFKIKAVTRDCLMQWLLI